MCISSNAKGQGLVDSCLLGNSYLESVPRSHYGGKAVVPLYREPSERGVPVSQLLANNVPLAQSKTATEAAVSVDTVLQDYAFLRLAIPIRPRSPEPKSQTAAGTGTTT